MNNPHAFPCDSRESAEFAGMTLRDYFAAKAMTGLLADSELQASPAEFAIRSYALADAMLEARK